MAQAQAKTKFYAIQKYENDADIYIFGDIVEDEWWDGDVSAIGLVGQIKDLDVNEIRVHVNSYGGSVSAGWAIYSALREHKAKIVTYADGFVASAANYPFLAGDERYASAVSAFYLHNVSTFAMGYASDLRKAADEIEKLTDIGINAFVERAGMDRETVQALMDGETWLSPEEALEYGIATAVVTDKSDTMIGQSARKAVLQMIFPADMKREHVIIPKEEKRADEQIIEEKPAEQETEQAPEQIEESAADENKPEKTLFEILSGIFND